MYFIFKLTYWFLTRKNICQSLRSKLGEHSVTGKWMCVSDIKVHVVFTLNLYHIVPQRGALCVFELMKSPACNCKTWARTCTDACFIVTVSICCCTLKQNYQTTRETVTLSIPPWHPSGCLLFYCRLSPILAMLLSLLLYWS